MTERPPMTTPNPDLTPEEIRAKIYEDAAKLGKMFPFGIVPSSHLPGQPETEYSLDPLDLLELIAFLEAVFLPKTDTLAWLSEMLAKADQHKDTPQ